MNSKPEPAQALQVSRWSDENLSWWDRKEVEARTGQLPPRPEDERRVLRAARQVKVAYARLGNWEKVAGWYGAFNRGTYHRLANDPEFHPSAAVLEQVEARGTPPRVFQVAGCPDCGQAHLAGRCHGEPGSPQWVPSGAKIILPKPASGTAPKRRRRTAYWRPCLPLGLREAAKSAGVDVEAAVRQAIEARSDG